MVAEDDANIRRGLGFILKKEFDVTLVENGELALENIRQGLDYDVVSLDIQMPGMSGIETLEAIKKHNPDMEILLISGYSDIESTKRALKLGAYDFIDKPFDKAEVRKAIRKGVERRKRSIESERTREKLKFVKGQLQESEKFTAIGQLIAGVVHELNNPLGIIMAYSDLLLMTDYSPDKRTEILKYINKSALLCKSVVEKLLAFSRSHEPKREMVQINEIIESTLDLKQHDFKIDGIQLEKSLGTELPETLADYHALQQVFLNLVNNAHQAMAHTPEKKLSVFSELEGDSLRIKFHDTGEGISDENLNKIFEPLFTTKEKGKGTGLGLSLCYDIIRDHHGDIYVASEKGNGTWFIIEIPVVSAEATGNTISAERKRDFSTLKVLFISDSDEEGVILNNMLTLLGSSCEIAADASTAEEKLRRNHYDIILSSLQVSGVEDFQFFEKMNGIQPDFLSRLILLLSGIINEEEKLLIEREHLVYITKPYGIQDIQEALEKVLSKR